LHTNYNQLFLNNDDGSGIYFAIAFDGIHTQTYGGTTFLTHAPVGGGCCQHLDQWWLGVSERQQLVDKFSENTTDTAILYGQTKEIKT
jgi:hypothetical protein